MRLQRFLDLSEATNASSFEQQLIGFAHEMGFGLVMGVFITDVPGADRQVVRVGNIPAAFEAASQSLESLARDPVNRRLQKMSIPFVYDQDLYVKEHAGDLWEEQAPYGYRTGISVGLHLPGRRHFLLGFDRESPLPRSELKLTRMLADLQLVAVHAQSAAARLLPKAAPASGGLALTPREQDVLRLTMQGKTAREVGEVLFCSEHTVNFHLRKVLAKLEVSSKHQAALKATALGLI